VRAAGLACVRCGRKADGILGEGCTRCAAEGVAANLATVYDLDRAREELLAALDGPVRGIARYEAVLPVTADELATPDTGGTPLVDAPRLAAAAGVARVAIKDESRGPTWSFKDRAAAIAAAHARALDRPGVIAASTGNAAAATAAHAVRAGVPAIILFARGVSPTMSAFVRAYGAHVATTPTKADRWTLMRHWVRERGWYPNSNFAEPAVGNNPYAIDGYKTIGYELWEQLGRRAPDAVYFAVCYGDGLFGVGKAFDELRAMGLCGSGPRLSGGEIHGSLERALRDDVDVVEPAEVDRPTAAFSISASQSTYQALSAVRESAGWVSAISEEELAAAHRLFAEEAGMFVETATAAALAALLRHREEGRVGPDEEIVLVSSSTGLKSIDHQRTSAEPPLVTNVDALVDLLEGGRPAHPAATRRMR
jgi:threonine synthase